MKLCGWPYQCKFLGPPDYWTILRLFSSQALMKRGFASMRQVIGEEHLRAGEDGTWRLKEGVQFTLKKDIVADTNCMYHRIHRLARAK